MVRAARLGPTRDRRSRNPRGILTRKQSPRMAVGRAAGGDLRERRKGRRQGGECGAKRRADQRGAEDTPRPRWRWGWGREAPRGRARAAHTHLPLPLPARPAEAPSSRGPRTQGARTRVAGRFFELARRGVQSQPRSFKAGRALRRRRRCRRAAAMAASASSGNPPRAPPPSPSSKGALPFLRARTSAPRPRSCWDQ